MSDKDNKLERLKNRLIKLQAKIHERVEDFQDQVQTKIERSKLSRFVSHLSDERSFGDESSLDKDIADISSIESSEIERRSSSIPSLIVDEPNLNVDPKQICKDFLTIEKNGVLYRRCVSTSNLAADADSNLYSSSDSCFSCLSSSDERSTEIRPRAGSLPPGHTLDIPGAINSCSDLIERIGNRFPRLKSKGDRIHRVFLSYLGWWLHDYGRDLCACMITQCVESGLVVITEWYPCA